MNIKLVPLWLLTKLLSGLLEAPLLLAHAFVKAMSDDGMRSYLFTEVEILDILQNIARAPPVHEAFFSSRRPFWLPKVIHKIIILI